MRIQSNSRRVDQDMAFGRQMLRRPGAVGTTSGKCVVVLGTFR
jgi:hypothetical protein